jgi:hypothetical protein
VRDCSKTSISLRRSMEAVEPMNKLLPSPPPLGDDGALAAGEGERSPRVMARIDRLAMEIRVP